jgi:hypothetical protein
VAAADADASKTWQLSSEYNTVERITTPIFKENIYRKAIKSTILALTPWCVCPAAEKVLLAAAMKAGTDVSNGWLCERLGMGTPASVSQFVRQFRLDGGTEQAGFSAALLRLKM